MKKRISALALCLAMSAGTAFAVDEATVSVSGTEHKSFVMVTATGLDKNKEYQMCPISVDGTLRALFNFTTDENGSWQGIVSTSVLNEGNRITAAVGTTQSGEFTVTNADGSSSSSGGGGSSSISSGYSITVKKNTGGTVKLSRTRAKNGDTVTVTVVPNTGYELDDLVVTNNNGDDVSLSNKGDNKYSFTMPDSKVTVEATFAQTTEQPDDTQSTSSFTDVDSSAYYYDAVQWAVANGITAGTSITSFSPDMTCTRAQVVTFLWRANGSPAPASSLNPFTDIAAGSYYNQAVLWAVEKGITNGTSATTFGPDASCTRAQVATFLWRAQGSPATLTSATFTDVPASEYYASAVAWASSTGITAGTSASTFSPNDICTRGQIVTFLFRALGK